MAHRGNILDDFQCDVSGWNFLFDIGAIMESIPIYYLRKE